MNTIYTRRTKPLIVVRVFSVIFICIELTSAQEPAIKVY